MRIVMLNYEFPPIGGGAANANFSLLKEFAKSNNITVDLITSTKRKKDNNIVREKFSENITIYKIPIKKKSLHFWKLTEIISWSIRAWMFAKKITKKRTYTCCHAWSGWPCGIIAKQLNIPYLVALRGSDVPGYSKRLQILDKVLFKEVSKKVWKQAFAVTTNSQGLLELAQKTSKIPMCIIPNGVDRKVFKPIKKTSSKKNNHIQLISTGRLIPRKGYQILIPALAKLPTNISLTLIGEGSMQKELQRLAKKHQVNVTFTGKVNKKELVSHLQEADVFILPSFNEGMSNSVLEAMSCGLPIIATEVGGTNELVDETNGYIIKPTVQSIRQTLSQLSKKDLTKKGKVSSTKAKNFTWKFVAKKYQELYSCAE